MQTSATTPFTFSRATIAHTGHPERNEDNSIADRQRGLAAVFDGVGGAAYGDVASRTAAKIIQNGWKRALAQPKNAKALPFCQQLEMRPILIGLIEQANQQLRNEGERLATEHEKSSNNIQYPETTFALAAFCYESDSQQYSMTYAHVGDSRIYLLRQNDVLQRLTADDGFFSLLLEEGIIDENDALRIDQATTIEQLSEAELGYFEKRNGITQSLGEEQLIVHFASLLLAPGDRILLCTDGVHDNLTDTELETFLKHGARTTVAKQIVQSALQRSQQDKNVNMRAKADDITAVVVSLKP